MTVTNNPFAALLVDQIGMDFDKDIDLGLNSLHQHPTRTLTQKAKQRIVFDNTAWSRQADNGIVSHGVSFQTVISSITKDTPPKPSSTKFSYSPRPIGTTILLLRKFGFGCGR